MKKGLTFVLILISSFFLIACGNERVKYLAEDFYSMNTIISITVPEEMKEDENYKNAHLEVREMFDFIHDLTDNFTRIESHKVINSIYDINDTLVNSSEQFHQFEINFELYEILQISQEMENLTDGHFNISIGKIIDLWKENVVSKQGVISNDVIADTIEKADQIEVIRNSFELEEVSGKYYVTIDTRVKLDVGAVAKGYALQLAIDIFNSYEIQDYIISAGSSSIGLGEKKPISGQNQNEIGYYRIGFINPDRTWTFYAIAKAKLTNATTSGNYEQFSKDEDGNIYHHLISPITKRPENYYGTVTVISSDHAGKIDALTTALYVMTPEVRSSFLEQYNYETISYSNGTFHHINPVSDVENRLES